jgi:hypothetical protein
MAHCYWERSLEVLLGDKTHLVMYEQGGLSIVRIYRGTTHLSLIYSLISTSWVPFETFKRQESIKQYENVLLLNVSETGPRFWVYVNDLYYGFWY